jgi:hypothetical protein
MFSRRKRIAVEIKLDGTAESKRAIKELLVAEPFQGLLHYRILFAYNVIAKEACVLGEDEEGPLSH